jgi:hypothetical protein
MESYASSTATVARPAAPPPDPSAIARSQFDAMVRRGLFRACERFVPYGPDHEDRVAEGLAMTWCWFERQVVAGRRPDVALVRHVARRRMVDRSHRFLGGDHRPRRDPFDRQGLDVEMRRLDAIAEHDDEGDERREDPFVGLARLGVQDPTANLLSAMDLDAWLDMLASADRDLVELRGAGMTFKEIGKATGRSLTGAFHRARRLGCELAQRAGLSVRPRERA